MNVCVLNLGKIMCSIGVVILTLNAEKHLFNCLSPLVKSSLKPKILVVDSSSTDQTVKIAKQFAAEVITIDRNDFNHGKTREFARKKIGTDIVIFLTADAYAIDEFAFEKLIDPILRKKASLAYGRQVPHRNASFFESFPRLFNYPEKNQIRCIANLTTDGSFTYFFSDSFSAYLNSALDEISGFKKVVLGEDTLAAAELIKKGHKLAYVADAVVQHSHNYTLKEEFSRYFDAGLMRQEHRDILNCSMGDKKRGREYVRQMFMEIKNNRIKLLPYACLHVIAKLTGFYLG